MSWEEVAGNWNQFKGKIKEKWGELTDDELDVIDGEWDQLVGSLQARYAISKKQAEREVAEFCSRCPALIGK